MKCGLVKYINKWFWNVLNKSKIGIADWTKEAYKVVYGSLNFLTKLARKIKLS